MTRDSTRFGSANAPSWLAAKEEDVLSIQFLPDNEELFAEERTRFAALDAGTSRSHWSLGGFAR